MQPFIKGEKDWHEKLNSNFEEVEESIDDIKKKLNKKRIVSGLASIINEGSDTTKPKILLNNIDDTKDYVLILNWVTSENGDRYGLSYNIGGNDKFGGETIILDKDQMKKSTAIDFSLSGKIAKLVVELNSSKQIIVHLMSGVENLTTNGMLVQGILLYLN